MSSRMEFDIELRGQVVTIDCAVLSPDPSVGMCGFSFEDACLSDESGTILDWELTDDECIKVSEHIAGSYDYGYDD